MVWAYASSLYYLGLPLLLDKLKLQELASKDSKLGNSQYCIEGAMIGFLIVSVLK